MDKKQYWPIIIVASILGAASAYIVLAPNSSFSVEKEAQTNAPLETRPQTLPAEVPPPMVDSKKSVAKPKVLPPVLTYEQAMGKYGSNRIQLDPQCNAISSQMTVKNGTELMLDNRSSEERVVVFNLKNYKIPAYGFVVVKAQASSVPTVTFIDCDQQQNVATVSIQ